MATWPRTADGIAPLPGQTDNQTDDQTAADHVAGPQDGRLAAAQALLDRVKLSPQETARRFDAVLDMQHWRRLVPFATVEAPEAAGGDVRIAADEADRERRRIDEDGYFHLNNVFDPERIGRMRRIVEAVRADGWPAVFAFVFDDFWTIARSPRLLGFLETSLGEACLQNTVVWVHWVAGARGGAGWHPHVDANGLGAAFLSAWIPLSDATVDNGCMFLVRPGAMTDEVAEALDARAALPYAAYRDLLHNVVALPAPAGSLIGWRGDVLHWGGNNAGAVQPRVSMALEFRSRDAEATDFEWPLIDPRAPVPAFQLRLFAIAKALKEYSKFEPLVSRFLPLAERLWSHTKPAR